MKTLFNLHKYILTTIKNDQNYEGAAHNYQLNTFEIGIRNYKGQYEINLYTRYRFKENGLTTMLLLIKGNKVIIGTVDQQLDLRFRIKDRRIKVMSYTYENENCKISHDYTTEKPYIMITLFKKIPLGGCQYYEQITQYFNDVLRNVRLERVLPYKEGCICKAYNNVINMYLSYDLSNRLSDITIYFTKQKYTVYHRIIDPDNIVYARLQINHV